MTLISLTERDGGVVWVNADYIISMEVIEHSPQGAHTKVNMLEEKSYKVVETPAAIRDAVKRELEAMAAQR